MTAPILKARVRADIQSRADRILRELGYPEPPLRLGAAASRRSSSDDQRQDASATFKRFTYAEIIARDKANLDILWLKDESLEDSENLPAPAILAAEIVASLETALEEFRAVRRRSRLT